MVTYTQFITEIQFYNHSYEQRIINKKEFPKRRGSKHTQNIKLFCSHEQIGEINNLKPHIKQIYIEIFSDQELQSKKIKSITDLYIPEST
jgi:hypothetical protein